MFEDVNYTLELSRDSKTFNLVYKGDAIEITLKDLCPFTGYHLRVFASLTSQFRGDYTESVSFMTRACEPERPKPPKFVSKKKSEMTLRWNSPVENGSKIIDYVLEYKRIDANEIDVISSSVDYEANGAEPFVQIYKGPHKQFIMRKLQPNTYYAFRIAAENEFGLSMFSTPLITCTAGSVPDQPEPPFLAEASTSYLTLRWNQIIDNQPRRSFGETTYELQKRDPEHIQQGFITVSNGPQLSYTVTELKKASTYEFRVSTQIDHNHL